MLTRAHNIYATMKNIHVHLICIYFLHTYHLCLFYNCEYIFLQTFVDLFSFVIRATAFAVILLMAQTKIKTIYTHSIIVTLHRFRKVML